MKSRLVYNILIISSIALISLPVFANEIDDLKNQIDQKAKEIAELRQREDEYKGAISNAHESAHSLEDVIGDLNGQIRKLENDLSINEKEISYVKLGIKRTELEIIANENSIKRTVEFIAEILREIYEGGDQQIAELIFKYNNFSEFFDQVQYRELLQESLSVRLREIGEFKEKLEAESIELDNNHKELENLKKELEDKSSILGFQRSKKEGILRDTHNEEWRYKELLKTTRDSQEAIQREIFALEDNLRQAIDSESIPASRPGVLSWPTEGILTQGYGCTKFAKVSKFYPTCFHNGIDVAASYGTLVKSAQGGKVIAVQNAPYAYGKWVAVEHDNGLVTLYGHLSLQSVDVGQKVDLGEVIGYMGSTGFSTGSHLHFTVYAPNTFLTKPSTIAGILPIGATINPFNYLP